MPSRINWTRMNSDRRGRQDRIIRVTTSLGFELHTLPVATYQYMRSLVYILIGIAAALQQVEASALAGLGTALSVGTGLLPPELRGITGALANVALAQQNKAKGIIEVVQDGSDYPFICICPTATQIKAIKDSTGVTLTATKCAEDTSMGCKPAQVNMDSVPLPVVKTTTSKSR